MGMRNALSALLLLGLTGAATAADQPWWKFWGGVAENAADAATVSVVQDVTVRTFTPHQQRVLRDFLTERSAYADGRHDRDYDDDRDDRKHHHKDKGKGKDKRKPLPPGLQKKLARGGELPPGWQKKLARGEVVDDAIWRQSRHLPSDWLHRLGPLPADTELRYVEDKVYRVMRNTREIVDILGL